MCCAESGQDVEYARLGSVPLALGCILILVSCNCFAALFLHQSFAVECDARVCRFKLVKLVTAKS